MSEKGLKELLRRMPTKWTCCECGRGFQWLPDGPAPEAVKTEVDLKTGRRREVGHICADCFTRPAMEGKDE